MQILKTKTTRWLYSYESTLFNRISRIYHKGNSLHYHIDSDSEYIYDPKSNTRYLTSIFFFRYTQYAIWVWTSEANMSRRCFVVKLSKKIQGEGDGWYCREQFELLISEGESSDNILYHTGKVDNDAIRLIHLSCLDEMADLVEDQKESTTRP